MSDRIRILIADDHALLREALRAVLNLEEDLEVVGEAESGPQAVAVAEQVRPDVVLLDIDMPGAPASTVRQLLNRPDPPCVVMLSMYEDPEFVQFLLGLGISGYLQKNVSRQHLVSVIRTLRYSDQVALSVSRASMTYQGRQANVLSEREREVLKLAAAALSNRQIALRLAITEGTVKRHMSNIFQKLDAVSRIDAVNKAAALESPEGTNPSPPNWSTGTSGSRLKGPSATPQPGSPRGRRFE